MYNIHLIILMCFFSYTSCITNSSKSEEKQPTKTSSQFASNKIAFLNWDGFLPSNSYKIEYHVYGCFQNETQSIHILREPDGSIVAFYNERKTGENVNSGFRRVKTSNTVSQDISNLITQCKLSKQKEKNEMIFSITTSESVTITDGLHFKTYFLGDELNFNPFFAFKNKIFSEKF